MKERRSGAVAGGRDGEAESTMQASRRACPPGCVRCRRGRRVGAAGDGPAVRGLVATDALARELVDVAVRGAGGGAARERVRGRQRRDLRALAPRVRRAARRPQRRRAAHPRPEPGRRKPLGLGAHVRRGRRARAPHHLDLAQRPQRARARSDRRALGSRVGHRCVVHAARQLRPRLPRVLRSVAQLGSGHRARRRVAPASRLGPGAGLDRGVHRRPGDPRGRDRPRGGRGHRRRDHSRCCSRSPEWSARSGTVLSIVVVREITARQEVLQARDPAPLERPSSASTPRPPRSTGRAGTPTRAVATTTGTGTAPRGPST